jgi:hypothetical protein
MEEVEMTAAKYPIDLSKLMEMTGGGRRELVYILGLPIEGVETSKAVSASNGDAKHLIRALRLLAEQCGYDYDKMRAWFTEPKVYWHGLSPIDMFMLRRGEAVVETLRAVKDGEALIGG